MNTRNNLFALCLIAAGACTTRIENPPIAPAPKVVSFTATPAEVAAGGTITLSWSVEHATKVSIRELASGPVAGVDDKPTGSVDVTASRESAFFILTAENSRGVRATSVASVLVQGAPTNVLFQAVPTLVGPTEPAMLVWSAPGARVVTITDGSGAMLDLDGQLTAGSLLVNPPGAETTYTLSADGRTAMATIARAQSIDELTATPAAARPGDTVTISWKTTNASRVVLTSPGIGTIATVTDAAQVASGSAMQVVPNYDMELGLPFVLRAEGKGAVVERAVTIFFSSSPAVLSATAPEYARTGTTFPLTWTTRGADQVRISAGGVVLHQGAAQGTVHLPAPAMDTDYSVVAVQTATGDTSAPTVLNVKPVGAPAVVAFTPDRTAITNGGDAVVLTWNVTNARRVIIIEEGSGVVHQATGPSAASGTVTVYPNQHTTRYELQADNQVGEFITPQTLSIAVTNLATLTFNRRAPVGANVEVTGSTVPAGGAVSGLMAFRLNPPGVSFVDISQTGTLVALPSQDSSYLRVDIRPFTMPFFGQRVVEPNINVTVDGFFAFTDFTVSPGPSSWPADLGDVLLDWAIVPFLGNLRLGSGAVQYQIDTVGTERRVIVQWTDLEEVANPSNTVTFQAQVYESGRVVFAYRDLGTWSTPVATGIVGDNDEALDGPVLPLTGQVWELGGEALLPQRVRVRNESIVGFVKMPNGKIRVEGDPRLPSTTLGITEVNARPLVPQGEWLEIVNQGAQPQDIGGWELRTDAGTQRALPPLTIPPGGRVLLGEAPAANDGLMLDAVYGGRVSLPDGGGGAISLAADGIVVARIDLASPGVTSAIQADLPAPWMRFPNTSISQLTCGTDAGYGTNGQLGTPGAQHPRCFPYVLTDAGVPFTSIALTGTRLVAGTSPASDDTVFSFDPGGPVKIGHVMVPTLWVSTNGFISPTSITNSTITNKTAPSVTAPAPGTIAPFWDNLIGSLEPGSGIYWERRDVGTPNESVIVSWEKWRVDSTTVSTSLNFQARFWPNGDITFAYGDMTASGTSTVAKGSSATAWVEDPNGRAAVFISVNSATAPGIQPNTSFRFVYSP